MTVVYTSDLGRTVLLRDGTMDEQVWADTFTGRYHLPPADDPFVPETVLDLGANVGLVAAHYKALWPDALVVAVEMDPGNAAMLLKNAPGVELVEVAVSDFDGVARYDPSRQSDSFKVEPTFVTDELNRQRVFCSTPGQLIVRHLFGHADFVKMDVEGMEWRLLSDTNASKWAHLVDRILVEFHDDERHARDDVLAEGVRLLETAGFEARHHWPHPQAVYGVRR